MSVHPGSSYPNRWNGWLNASEPCAHRGKMLKKIGTNIGCKDKNRNSNGFPNVRIRSTV